MAEQLEYVDPPLDRVAAALERLADQQGAYFRSLERQTVALEAMAQALSSIVVFARDQEPEPA